MMSNATDLRDKTFFIIAGQPKAGTTSLFEWLKSHPDICSARLKETRFFLDDGYPLKRPLAFNGSNLESYGVLYEDHSKHVLMEATPDYMYCETPLRIAELLPNSRVAVIIRNPMERMVSAFRFFKQRGLIENGMSFDEYVAYQNERPVDADTPVHYRALDHCSVEHYLRPWRVAFGDSLLVIKFADLREGPVDVVSQVCDFIGVDPSKLDAQTLSPANRSGRARWPALARNYYAMSRRMAMTTMNYPSVKKFLRPLNGLVKKALIDDVPQAQIVPSARSIEILQEWAEKGVNRDSAGEDSVRQATPSLTGT